MVLLVAENKKAKDEIKIETKEILTVNFNFC
jgi:hypothetical protein